jgi:hypothetical protein
VAAILLVLPTTAWADEPIMRTISVDFTRVEPPNTFTNPCAFSVTVREAGTADFTIFVDQSGQPVSEHITTPQFEFTYTGPKGTSLSSRSPASEHIDILPGMLIDKITGMELDFHLPGSGTLFKIAGQNTLRIDFTTRPVSVSVLGFTGTRTSDSAEFCALLSS